MELRLALSQEGERQMIGKGHLADPHRPLGLFRHGAGHHRLLGHGRGFVAAGVELLLLLSTV